MSKITQGAVTKNPSDVLKILSDNATVNASPAAGVAATAKGTEEQDMVAQLNQYYQKKAEDTAYADYLTNGQYTQNMNYANYLTNGKYSGYPSFEDYLYVTGQTPGDSQTVRDKTVAQANADYEKAKATYGQTGEQLARSGLTNTGYSDAITNAAYAAKQGAIAQANATKAATDTSNRIGYAQYLQVYDAQQQEKMLTVLEYTTQAGMSEEQAKAYAKAVGFDDTIAESIGKAQAAYTSAASGAGSQKATDLYNSLVSQDGFTYDPATNGSLRQQLLNSGYDSSTVDDVMSRLESNYSAQQEDMYNLFLKSLTDSNTFEQIGAGIEGWDDMDVGEKTAAVLKNVIQSSITDMQKENIILEAIEKNATTIESKLNTLSTLKSMGISESIYNDISAKMGYYVKLNEYGYPVSAFGETIDIFPSNKSLKSYAKKEFPSLGKGKSGVLVAGNNGIIYMGTGTNEWYIIDNFNQLRGFTEEQKSALYDITYQRLKQKSKQTVYGSPIGPNPDGTTLDSKNK